MQTKQYNTNNSRFSKPAQAQAKGAQAQPKAGSSTGTGNNSKALFSTGLFTPTSPDAKSIGTVILKEGLISKNGEPIVLEPGSSIVLFETSADEAADQVNRGMKPTAFRLAFYGPKDKQG